MDVVSPLRGGGDSVCRNTLGDGYCSLDSILLFPLVLTHKATLPQLQAVCTRLGRVRVDVAALFCRNYKITTSCGSCIENTASPLMVLRTQGRGSESKSRGTGNIPVAFLLWTSNSLPSGLLLGWWEEAGLSVLSSQFFPTRWKLSF